jgi:hypothetical protein
MGGFAAYQPGPRSGSRQEQTSRQEVAPLHEVLSADRLPRLSLRDVWFESYCRGLLALLRPPFGDRRRGTPGPIRPP